MSALVDVKKAYRVIVAVIAALAVACAVSLSPAVCEAQAADSLTASYSTKAGSFKSVKMGKTAGSAKSSAKPLLAIKVAKKSKLSGNVSYSLYCQGKKYSASNGRAAGKKYKAHAMTVKLSKSLAKKYDVWYRVYIKDYGWLAWTKNGAKAGTSVKSKYVTAYQVKLVKKGKSVSGAYSNGAYVDSKFFKLTGNLKADAKIVTVAKSQKTFPKCVNWVAKSIAYKGGTFSKLPKGTISSSNLKKAAIYAFSNSKGNCYEYTAAVAYFAKYFGYSYKPISGSKAAYASAAQYATYDKSKKTADDAKKLVGAFGVVDGTLVKYCAATDSGKNGIDVETGLGYKVYDSTVRIDGYKPVLSGGTYFVKDDGNLYYLPKDYSWCEVKYNGAYNIYDALYQWEINRDPSAQVKKVCKATGFTYEYALTHAKGMDDECETHLYIK